MTSRGLATLSIALYAMALVLPALGPTRAGGGAIGSAIPGWSCLIFGLQFAMFVTPLAAWIVNPWLWVLWFRILARRPGPSPSPWALSIFAGVSLFLICGNFGLYPDVGAWFWLAAILSAGYARQLDAREMEQP